MARAWHVHGMCVACAWHVRGMCMACAWHVHGMTMACAYYEEAALTPPTHLRINELPEERDRERAVCLDREVECPSYEAARRGGQRLAARAIEPVARRVEAERQQPEDGGEAGEDGGEEHRRDAAALRRDGGEHVEGLVVHQEQHRHDDEREHLGRRLVGRGWWLGLGLGVALGLAPGLGFELGLG